MGYGIEQSFGLGQAFNLYQDAKNSWQSLLASVLPGVPVGPHPCRGG